MSPLDPIFQVNELPSQLFPGLETPSTYPLPQLLMSEATTIYLNIWRGRLLSASLGICPLPLVPGSAAVPSATRSMAPRSPGAGAGPAQLPPRRVYQRQPAAEAVPAWLRITSCFGRKLLFLPPGTSPQSSSGDLERTWECY